MTKRMSLLLTRLVLLTLGLSLMACGPSKMSSDLSSRMTAEEIKSSDKPLAKCNGGESSNMGAQLMAALDPSGGWSPTYVYLKFNKIPSALETNGLYIQFFRWAAASSGTTTVDPVPLKFQIMDMSSRTVLSSAWKNIVAWPELATAISATGISDTTSLFRRIGFRIDLRDLTGEFDVLRTSLYLYGQTSTAEMFDTLLPIFHANPADYAKESSGVPRAAVLQGLHPLRGTTLSNAEYTSKMDAFCAIFQ